MAVDFVYIIAHVDRAVAFEWISDEFHKRGTNIGFILLNPSDSYLESFLRNKGRKVKRIELRGKKDYFSAGVQLFFTLWKWKTKLIHCHIRDANLLALPIAKLLGIKKRIYTRHSSTQNQEYHPHAVKYDKLCNTLATEIVAISENVVKVLVKEEVKRKKIHLIHHGFDLSAFSLVNEKDIRDLKLKYLFEGRTPVIGVISRYLDLKGYEYIIPACAKILRNYPNAHFIFANANGLDEKKVKDVINEYLPSTNFTEIKFERNLFALYKLFDIFIHTPINKEVEAFGQGYVEALAAGVPSIFTLSGVAPEFIEHNYNAIVVNYKSTDDIYNGIERLLTNDQVREKLIINGRKSVNQFDLKKMINKLETLYTR